jgi:hypothetical protein
LKGAEVRGERRARDWDEDEKDGEGCKEKETADTDLRFFLGGHSPGWCKK